MHFAMLIDVLRDAGHASGDAQAQTRYTAKQTADVVQLRDSRTDTTVSVVTTMGNAYEMVVKGQNVIRMPFATVDEFRARPGLNGIPLLAPFANRLDEHGVLRQRQEVQLRHGARKRPRRRSRFTAI